MLAELFPTQSFDKSRLTKQMQNPTLYKTQVYQGGFRHARLYYTSGCR